MPVKAKAWRPSSPGPMPFPGPMPDNKSGGYGHPVEFFAVYYPAFTLVYLIIIESRKLAKRDSPFNSLIISK